MMDEKPTKYMIMPQNLLTANKKTMNVTPLND